MKNTSKTTNFQHLNVKWLKFFAVMCVWFTLVVWYTLGHIVHKSDESHYLHNTSRSHIFIRFTFSCHHSLFSCTYAIFIYYLYKHSIFVYFPTNAPSLFIFLLLSESCFLIFLHMRHHCLFSITNKPSLLIFLQTSQV